MRIPNNFSVAGVRSFSLFVPFRRNFGEILSRRYDFDYRRKMIEHLRYVECQNSTLLTNCNDIDKAVF